MKAQEHICGIITSFNQAETLKDSVESLIHQDIRSLIIIDDKSSDKSQNLIRDLARKYKKILPILNCENKGVSASLNKAFGVSKSRYVVIQGGDDVALFNRIQLHREQLKTHPKIAVHLARPKMEFIPKEKLKMSNKNYLEFYLFKTGAVSPKDLFFNENKLCAPTALLDLNFFRNKRIFRENLIQLQDFWLWIELAWQGNVYLHDHALVEYGISDKPTLSSKVNDSTSHNYIRNRIERRWVYKNFFTKQTQKRIHKFFSSTELENAHHVNDVLRNQLIKIQYYLSHPLIEIRELGIESLYDLLELEFDPDIILQLLGLTYSDLRDLTYI